MDYLKDVEFWDWLMWDKEVSEKDWLESDESTKSALYDEFRFIKSRKNKSR